MSLSTLLHTKCIASHRSKIDLICCTTNGKISKGMTRKWLFINLNKSDKITYLLVLRLFVCISIKIRYRQMYKYAVQLYLQAKTSLSWSKINDHPFYLWEAARNACTLINPLLRFFAYFTFSWDICTLHLELQEKSASVN